MRTRAQLSHVRAHGTRFVGRRTVLSVAESPDGRGRAVFIISRRYSRKAVVRNRARRLFREVYRLLRPRLRPVWVVFIPRYRMPGATLQNVLDEATEALRKLGAFTDTSDPQTEA
ncbi:MAG: ribonuclease P protein component [Lentisphaeria bacterium]|nr:ribonuclease P protein component [Lentisphaeria bacterium]